VSSYDGRVFHITEKVYTIFFLIFRHIDTNLITSWHIKINKHYDLCNESVSKSEYKARNDRRRTMNGKGH
jgi:hypothetical protein